MFGLTVYFTSSLVGFLLLLLLFGYGGTINDISNNSRLPFFTVAHASSEVATGVNTGCVSYDEPQKTIMISCNDIRLTDINKQINDPLILVENYNGEKGVWFLDANVVINKDSTLIVDPQDTKWLKIAAGGDKSLGIQILGSLVIDSVKVTSWNPEINNYVKFKLDVKPYPINDTTAKIGKVPRPYIVSEDATGSTNITNSELAYLGYDCGGGRCHGLTFYGGNGVVIKDSNIHHNSVGFYSNGLGHAVLENNHVHHNYGYGFDPHTGTHDMVIRNNTAHDNGGIGLVCSWDCYNITMEDNTVYNNVVAGMMISRNTYDSVVRNNIISNESTGISISESRNNEISNNTLINVKKGIDVKKVSVDNTITDNIIKKPLVYGFRITGNTTGNTLKSNIIFDAPENRAIFNEARAEVDKDKKNVFIGNNITNSCLSYDEPKRTITISCNDIRLTDIDKQINDPLILVDNYNGEKGVWFLNANLVVNKDSTLIIDPQDTKWLKIAAGGDKSLGIQILGSLVIDSVKVTSWNPEINNYTKFRLDKVPEQYAEEFSDVNDTPRPYIVIDNATGSTNITNSELAYLGYDCKSGRCHGLAFYGDQGDRNIVRANNIHHNNFGYYSNQTGEAVLEDNHVHHNYVYGFDPHTNTHDLTIRNNTVHDNGSIGIICSLDCYNIMIDNNTVFNNTKAGVMLSRLTFDSVVRNNTIFDESAGISISESYNNAIYNNTVSDVTNGIELKADSYDNTVIDNRIERPVNHGFRISENTTGNTLESNMVIDILDQTRAISVAKELMDVNILKENEVVDVGF